MSLIYKPKGKAREYSPLALNIYTGCDHGCYYCYNKRLPFLNKKVEPKTNILDRLMVELNRKPVTEQVLMSFVGDPYCLVDEKLQITRRALELLQAHDVPVAILTKGGERCLRDLDIFIEMNCKVGASLTFWFFSHSNESELGTATPRDRMRTLQHLHEYGVRTWASLEPVIDPWQTLALIDTTHEYVDEYRVGKLNHYDTPQPFSWHDFTADVVAKLRNYGKAFYIKQSLQPFHDHLTDAEKDPNALNLVSKEVSHA